VAGEPERLELDRQAALAFLAEPDAPELLEPARQIV
jgi:hypothetical protein